MVTDAPVSVSDSLQNVSFSLAAASLSRRDHLSPRKSFKHSTSPPPSLPTPSEFFICRANDKDFTKFLDKTIQLTEKASEAMRTGDYVAAAESFSRVGDQCLEFPSSHCASDTYRPVASLPQSCCV